MSTSHEKVTLIREIGKELGLESADASGGQDNSYISLKWIDNGVDMHLRIPGEDISQLEQNRPALRDYVARRIANGEAEKTPR